MKKTVKTDNKLCKKLFAILFTCSLILSGVPSAVLADHQNEPVNIDFSSATLPDYVTVTNGTVEDGMLKLTESGASINITKMIKPNTNYTFSFMMKNKEADSLLMERGEDVNVFHIGHYSDRPMDKLHHNQASYKDKTYGEAGLTYFIRGGSFAHVIPEDYTFGSEHAESAEIKFRKVGINFTTPPQKSDIDFSYVTLALSCAKDDAELAIDDLCLTETGDEPNRVFNGNFEALDLTGNKAVPMNHIANGEAFSSDYFEVVEEENGNHYLRIKEKPNQGSKYFYLGVAHPFQVKTDDILPNQGRRFKISVNYLVPDVSTNSANNKKQGPKMQFAGSADNGLHDLGHAYFPEARVGVWETYTTYIDASRYMTKGANKWDTSLEFGMQAHEFYLDDLYYNIDESRIDFSEKLEFYYVGEGDAKTRYFDISGSGASADNGTDKMYSTEKSIKAENLASISPESGVKKVTPRVHYIPTKNASGGYDEHNITLVAAVYGTDANGNRVLHNVKLASGTTTADGKTIDVKIDNLEVPAEGNYQVETMAINMDNMKPLVNKTILTNSGVVVEE